MVELNIPLKLLKDSKKSEEDYERDLNLKISEINLLSERIDKNIRNLKINFDDDIEGNLYSNDNFVFSILLETETSLKNELEMTMKDDFELYKCEKNKLAAMQDDHTRNMKELSDKNNIELQLSFGENENQLKANRTKFILENHVINKFL